MNNADLIQANMAEQARRSFWAYRQFMNPKMKKGWWQRLVAKHLQQFYDDLLAGLRPKLVIEAPPQHGKSYIVIDFISWLAGKNPDCKTIYTSFSERLGIRANLRLQRIFDSANYKKVFPQTVINESNAIAIAGKSQRNREIIEYTGFEGFFRNTTVGGAITGESLDLGVVDDPIKGREEAGSLTVRNKKWDWFTDDFLTRFSEDAGMLCILTRWHIDDPIGRLKEIMPEVKTVSYPAIAIRDEEYRKEGEALFPEHKSLEFLNLIKKTMAPASWESLYQQNPIIIGGEIIKPAWFGRYNILPKILWRSIYADTAQKTAEANDYSVLECWGLGDDGKMYLIDMIRGKWESHELEQRTIDFWNKHKAITIHGTLRALKIEDKASGTGLIQKIKSAVKPAIPVLGIPRTKDKLTRVQDVLNYIVAGYVMIPENAHFVSDFVAECEAFTADNSHAHDDQIDPMCDAINDMLATKTKGFFT